MKTVLGSARAARWNHRRAGGGFSLMEIAIAMIIIGILVAVVIMWVTGFFSEARETGYEADVRAVQSAVDAFYTECFAWPTEDGLQPRPGEVAAIEFTRQVGCFGSRKSLYPDPLAKLPKHWDERVWVVDSGGHVSVTLSAEEY